MQCFLFNFKKAGLITYLMAYIICLKLDHLPNMFCKSGFQIQCGRMVLIGFGRYAVVQKSNYRFG